MNFTHKVCVITGGAMGIGRCLAEEFARNGARVALIDTDRAEGENTLARIRDRGGDALFFPGDAADPLTLQAFAAAVISEWGGVDFLINNACVSRKGILSGCCWEDFQYVLSLGVAAPYQLTRLFLSHFRPGASVVNISSTRAFMSQPDTESYTAAKGGISALTHALSVSLAGRVRVNSVSPGWIDTGAYHREGYIPHDTPADTAQHPAGRIGVPMDIARAAMFLCSDDASFITGQNLTVDGGMTRLMVYSGDHGWSYDPPAARTDEK